jgi:hypothetical protein
VLTLPKLQPVKGIKVDDTTLESGAWVQKDKEVHIVTLPAGFAIDQSKIEVTFGGM